MNYLKMQRRHCVTLSKLLKKVCKHFHARNSLVHDANLRIPTEKNLTSKKLTMDFKIVKHPPLSKNSDDAPVSTHLVHDDLALRWLGNIDHLLHHVVGVLVLHHGV